MDDKELIRQQFGAHADAYRTSAPHATGPSLGRLLELVQPQPDWLVLDVSTGAGHMALALAPHVRQVTAADLTPEMLRQARRLALERGVSNLNLVAADAERLSFESNRFHLITNRIALHHYSDARAALAETTRVLASGGLFALADNIVPPDKATAGYINHFESMRDPSHHWCYPLERLEAMLSDAGLRVTHTETVTKEMEFDGWARRMGNEGSTLAALSRRLIEAPESVRAFLNPRTVEGTLFFSLTEGLLIAQKQ